MSATNPRPRRAGILLALCLTASASAPASGAHEARAAPDTRTRPGRLLLIGHSALSAAPAQFAAGDSGPVNRLAFDLQPPGRRGTPLRVACAYPGGLVYRCRAIADHPVDGPASIRVVVEVPDLDLGSDVTIRFDIGGAVLDVAVTLVNRPVVLHEIESAALRSGGATVIDGNGGKAPSMLLGHERIVTTPAIARLASPVADACDAVEARWVGATATDPVFTSEFGALNGTVVLARLPPRGAPVRADNGPEWLVTFPRGATRVQFIAHYEIAYRVGLCDERLVR